MELCSDDHEEVCFEGKGCPVCEMRGSLQTTIDILEKEIISLKDEVADLESESPN